MQEADLKEWNKRENDRTKTRRSQAQRAAQQTQGQPEELPEEPPALLAPIPVVLRMGGAIPRPRGRPKGSKNKPKNSED